LLKAFVAEAGWQNLTVGCDAERAALAAYFDAATSVLGWDVRNFPFAVIVGEAAGAPPGTVLWMGPVVDARLDAPLKTFEAALETILACDYSLEAAANLMRIIGDLGEALEIDDLDRIDALLSGVDGLLPLPEWAWGNLVLGRMNGIAWGFATREDKSERHLELAHRAVQIGLEVGGGNLAFFIDTHARLLYESGRVQEAYDTEKRAVEIAQGSLNAEAYERVLERYARDLGLASEDSLQAAEEAERGPEPPEVDLVAETVTREEAAQDLAQLHRLLEERYAGYVDVEWRLQKQGSSWEDRTGEFKDRIDERESWHWLEFRELIREYLEPVEDSHFSLMADTIVDTTVTRRVIRFVRTLVPFFGDVLVRRDGEDFDLMEVPEDLTDYRGLPVIDVEPVETPYTIEPGTPYLFPTLTEETLPIDEGEPSVFLLGVFADAKESPETVGVSLKLDTESPTGRPKMTMQIKLPLRRGRAALAPNPEATWSLTTPPESPLPVLAVRTMDERRLGGMVEAADTLRTLPYVVLDLRANGGGGDVPAMDWCQRFSGQRFDWVSGVMYASGDPNPLRRWKSWVGSPLSDYPGSAVAATAPYSGQLFVVTDANVASSGETFTHLSGQIPGALLLGENTRGCITYGNCAPHGVLENSRFSLWFGVTKFVPSWVRPAREGLGFFPDYWLDTEDPLSLIASYAAN
jgi:tetratricopeptide (TPR) repeat protein